MAAAIGVVLFRNTSVAGWAPALRFAAGLITVFFGLLMLGFRLPPTKAIHSAAEIGLVRNIFAPLLVNPGHGAALVLGLGVGFLPCPLPMAMLAAAAVSHSVPHAVALMTGVGLGTAPGLLAAGLFGAGLGRRFSRVGMRAAGLVVLAIGLLTIGRVTGVIAVPHAANHSSPCCCGEK